jgi:SAM-dependent methyltransferase
VSVELACPTCRRGLASTGFGLRCEPCNTIYPSVGGIECLVAEPAFLQVSLSRLALYRGVTRERAQELAEAARDAALPAKARWRLQRLADGLLAEEECLHELFEPVRSAAAAQQAPLAALGLMRNEPLAVVEYAEHLFRDWVWGEAENLRTRALVEQYLTEPVSALAVFGAGTARLALDLSRNPRVGGVLALDLNPLPFLVADRLLTGRAVDLWEFPLVPRSAEHVAVPRRLEPPAPATRKLRLILADALHAPLADQTLDVVVTPWFIDAVAADMAEVAAAVNRVLRPGGLWLNVGPLCQERAPAQAYSFEEVCDLVREGAFELCDQQQHALKYFDSPVSATCRIDRTYVFAARKVGPPKPRLAVSNGVAPWLEDPAAPIPVSAALAASLQDAIMTAGIASLVDGTRSTLDLAGILSQSWNVDAAGLVGPIQRTLLGIVGG